MHLGAHRGVDAIGTDEERAVDLFRRPIGGLRERGNTAVDGLAIAGDAAPQPDGIGPQPPDDLA